MKNRNINKNKDSGFVLLFVVVLSSIILSIALGIADIAYKEFTFSTSAKNTNEAFFAADTGIECALYHDQSGSTTAFGQPAPTPALACAGTPINISTIETPPDSYWTFEILELGSGGKACAIVTVHKNSVDGTTEIISKGYNVGGENPNCTSTDINRLERELVVRYSDIAPPAPTSFVLNVDVLSGTNTGGVVSDPAGAINCVNGTDDCYEEYPLDPFALVDLNAVAQPTFVFDSWGGDCSGTDPNVCSVLMNSNKTVSANFVVDNTPTYALNVLKFVQTYSLGTVSSVPAGINCDSSCSSQTASFSDVTLTASNGDGYFVNWYGDADNSTGCQNSTSLTCSFTMGAPDSITAFFGHRLLVDKNIPEGGIIDGVESYVPIYCGTDCEYISYGGFNLQAIPNPGYTFTGWSGDCTNPTGNCVVSLTSGNKNVTANFTSTGTPTHNIAVTNTVPTSGTVTSSPVGINCGSNCTSAFNEGSNIALTASETVAGAFMNWSGDACSGSTNLVCNVTNLLTDKNITANYKYILNVQKNGTGTGTVFSQVPTTYINCGSDCNETFNPSPATSLVLQFSADSGSTFAGWTGCTNTSGPGGSWCNVTMDASKTVTATFTVASNTPPTVTTNATSTTGQNTATSGGNITSNGGATVTTAGVLWHTTSNPTLATSGVQTSTNGWSSGTTNWTANITGLSCGTTYYMRAYATNSAGTGYGTTVIISTSACPAMSGNLSPDQPSCTINPGSNSCTIPFTWNTINPVAISAVTSDTNNTGGSSPNFNVANGNSGTSIPFTIPFGGRTFFLYNNGQQLASATISPANVSCATGSTWNGLMCGQVPTVTTPTSSVVTSSGATLGATVTSLGTPASISARGTCWGTSPAPTTNCTPASGTTTGTFTHARTGMAPNTTYFFRGYATNTTGTGYSTDGTFTTSSAVTNYALNVTKGGTGTGNVVSLPPTSPAIDCGTIACSQSYPSSTNVTLRATATSGSSFNGWAGCDSTSGADCNVSMTSIRNVTATFNTLSPTTSPPTVRQTVQYVGSTPTPSPVFIVPPSTENQDLLVAFVSHDANTLTWPAGWIQIFKTSQPTSGSTVQTFEVRYKISDGTDAGNAVSLNADVDTTYAIQAYVFSGYTLVPEVSVTFGNSTSPDSPNLTPSWGSAHNRWFAALALDKGGAYSGTSITRPIGYSPLSIVTTTTPSPGAALVPLYKSPPIPTTSENPGAFTLSTQDYWIAATIAIRGQ